MGYTGLVTIKDYAETDALWDGNELVVLTPKLSFKSSTELNNTPKNFQELIKTDETKLQAYARRKNEVAFSSFKNMDITCQIEFDKAFTTSTVVKKANGEQADTEVNIFLPKHLFSWLLEPRVVYLKDDFLVPHLSTVDDTDAVYESKGIPVMLKTWSIEPSYMNDSAIMKLTFVEAKE